MDNLINKIVNIDDLKSFIESNIESIKAGSNGINNSDENRLANTQLINKAIDILDESEIFKNANEHLLTNQILLLINNSIDCENKENRNEILNFKLYDVFEKIVGFYLEHGDWNFNAIRVIFNSLTKLAFIYFNEAIKQNINKNLLKSALTFLQKGVFVSVYSIENDAIFALHNTLVTFIYGNSSYEEGREKLKELDAGKLLIGHLNEINKNLNKRDELVYINIKLVATISSLVSADELNKLHFSHDICDTLIELLKQMILNGRITPKLVQGTKYYYCYKIANLTAHGTATSLLLLIIKLCLRDSVKQKLFELGIFDCIYELLERGNGKEVVGVCILIFVLSINENAREYLKNSQLFSDKIKELAEQTSTGEHNDLKKDVCKLILEALNSKDEYNEVA